MSDETLHDVFTFALMLVLIALVAWEHSQGRTNEVIAGALGTTVKHFLERAAVATRQIKPTGGK